jgi:hypothetical protein
MISSGPIPKSHIGLADKPSSKLTLRSIPIFCSSLSSIDNSQVTKLCGPEPLTKYVVLLVVSLQVACAYALRNTPFFSWTFFLAAYIIGATANQNLFLAIHEISHNLAFRSPSLNRAIAVFANLPIGIPYSASFRVCWFFFVPSFCRDGRSKRRSVDTPRATVMEALLFYVLFYSV